MMRESSFRKFHPWVILAYLVMVLTITMCSRHPFMILLSFGSSFGCSVYLSGWNVWKRTVLCGLSIAVFAVILMPLFYHNGITPLFYVNGLAVTKECLFYGLMMTLMLLAALQWFFVWDSLLREDRILYLVGRAMPGLALLITMSLRFVPLLAWRLREIRESQNGLGDRQGRHSVRDAMRDLSVLLSWSLEDSMETSVAMESRGYGLRRRSSFHLFRWHSRDGIMLFGMFVLFLLSFVQVWAGNMAACYFPALWFPADIRRFLYCGLPYLFLALAPLICDTIVVFHTTMQVAKRMHGNDDVWQQVGRRSGQECTGQELQDREKAYLEQWYGAGGNEDKI